MMREEIIASALQSLINASVKKDVDAGASRSFFRLDGFSDNVYMALLKRIQAHPYAHSRKIEARVTQELGAEFKPFELEAGRTATSYRNSLPEGQVLVLIFNRITADRQSLTNLFTINESLLAGKYLDYLLGAAFGSLSVDEVSTVRRFVQDLYGIREPQLYSLVDFLWSVRQRLDVHDDMATAIARCLPSVQLFRSNKIAEQLRTGKSVAQLLTKINRAATQTLQSPERKEIIKYLEKVRKAEFEDDVFEGGLTHSRKRQALEDYLRGFDNFTALRIDWQEVEQLLFSRAGGARKVKDETARLKDLGAQLKELLTKDQVFETLPKDEVDVIKNLLDGQRPDQHAVDVLVELDGERLGSKLAKELAEQLGTAAAHVTEDFVLGLTTVLIQLLKDVGAIPADLVLSVQALAPERPQVRAVEAFRCMFQSLPFLMPSLHFDFSKLPPMATEIDAMEDASTGDAGDESERTTEKLEFVLSVTASGEVLRSGRLVWEFRPNGPIWDLVASVKLERERIHEGRAPIPLFEQPGPNPFQLESLALSNSIGPWWIHTVELGKAWAEAPSKRYGLRPGAVKTVGESIERLEAAYANLLEGSVHTGILPHVDSLLAAYSDLLLTVSDTLVTAHEIATATSLINRAWVVHSRENFDWAVVPLLHPLKLFWLVSRSRHLNSLIERLTVPGSPPAAIDLNSLRREIPQRFSSAHFPAVLVLSDESTKRIFLPAEEYGGAELFRPSISAKGYLGTATTLDSDDATSLRVCADHILRVLHSYLETYPFLADGMSILMANVQSPALPLKVLHGLTNALDANPTLRVTVHAPGQGAPVYGAVNDWLHDHDELSLRAEHSYFPPVTVKVRDEDLMDLVHAHRYDVAILADVLSDKGQVVEVRAGSAMEDVPMAEYVPFFVPRQNPYEWGSTVRHVVLTPPKAPAFLRLFYNLQAACLKPDQAPVASSAVEFVRVLDLGEWTTRLKKLHEQCNWVVCYDINADRFLLENTGTKEAVRIIRYVMGLGPKKLHNLTVSSSGRARDEVIRRLTQRLGDLLALDVDFLKSLATVLVDQAQQLSGSVVLRATGPGTMLNELLGLVLAKTHVERRILEQWPNAMIAWVFLDDYQHWFTRGGKRPDLLCVASRVVEGTLEVRLVVTEAKCVEEGSFQREREDAIAQVHKGMDIIGRAFTPSRTFVDSEYWYSQLYQAIVSNLEVKVEHAGLVKALEQLLEGTHAVSVTGEAWVFCYDSICGQDQAVELIQSPDERVVGLSGNRLAVTQSLAQLLREARPDAPETIEPPAIPMTPPPELERMSVWLGQSRYHDGGGDRPEQDQSRLPVSVPQAEHSEVPGPVTDGDFQPMVEVRRQVEKPIGVNAYSGNLAYMLTSYDTAGDEADAHSYAKHCLTKATSFLRTLGLRVTPGDYLVGPRVIRLKLVLSIAPDSTYEKLAKHKTNLRLNLALPTDPYIQPGSDGSVWIDIPRPKPAMVGLGSLLSEIVSETKIPETRFPLGLTVDGKPFLADLRKVPHWLVGGTSGSGKSVFIRSVVLSLMLTNTPESLQFVIIDPKGDLVAFKNSSFVQTFVSSRLDMARQACEALKGVKRQMDERLTLMIDKHGTNEIDDFHQAEGRIVLPRVVVLIEEYGDLVSDDAFRKEIEQAAQQIAAIGRSSGFHLFICTQNPVVKTVSTDIKANCSGRVALWVKTSDNSRVILDESGAEDLLKNGDLLFKSDGPTLRLQAPFIDTMSELRPILAQMRAQYGHAEGGGDVG